MNKFSIAFWLIMQTAAVFSQYEPVSPASTAETNNEQIVINTEMIRRFNTVESEDGIYSWRQLLSGFDSQALQLFFNTYYSSDLESQTLASLKRSLEKALEEHNSMFNDDYINQINRIKAEINQKLAAGNQMLVSN